METTLRGLGVDVDDMYQDMLEQQRIAIEKDGRIHFPGCSHFNARGTHKSAKISPNPLSPKSASYSPVRSIDASPVGQAQIYI